jgi:hypothetical protein
MTSYMNDLSCCLLLLLLTASLPVCVQLSSKDDDSWRERYRAAAEHRRQHPEQAAAEPLEPGAAAAAAAGSSSADAAAAAAAVVSLVPVAEDEAVKERVTLWLAGEAAAAFIRQQACRCYCHQDMMLLGLQGLHCPCGGLVLARLWSGSMARCRCSSSSENVA